MHKLARQVRFSINPFLSQECTGFNSFASKPAGEGLSIFLELSVEVLGDIKPDTGFVVNVVDIDRGVREFVVPLFAKRIKQDFCRARHIGLFVVAGVLTAVVSLAFYPMHKEQFLLPMGTANWLAGCLLIPMMLCVEVFWRNVSGSTRRTSPWR